MITLTFVWSPTDSEAKDLPKPHVHASRRTPQKYIYMVSYRLATSPLSHTLGETCTDNQAEKKKFSENSPKIMQNFWQAVFTLKFVVETHEPFSKTKKVQDS